MDVTRGFLLRRFIRASPVAAARRHSFRRRRRSGWWRSNWSGRPPVDRRRVAAGIRAIGGSLIPVIDREHIAVELQVTRRRIRDRRRRDQAVDAFVDEDVDLVFAFLFERLLVTLIATASIGMIASSVENESAEARIGQRLRMKLLMTSTQKWTNRRRRDRRPARAGRFHPATIAGPCGFSSVEVFFTMPMRQR